MYTITDEELNTSGQLDQDPRYTVRDNNGNVLYDNVKIELKTPVSVEGTDINKATLEGIQTDLMNETKLVVAEYTVTSDTSSIEFTNLDFENDGSYYEIIIRGNLRQYASTKQVLLQLNNITSGYYYNLSTSTSNAQSSTAFVLETGYHDYIQAVATLTKVGDKYILASISASTDASTSGSVVYTHLVSSYVTSSSNVTSMTFLSNDAGNTYKSGTNIKIIKRR